MVKIYHQNTMGKNVNIANSKGQYLFKELFISSGKWYIEKCEE